MSILINNVKTHKKSLEEVFVSDRKNK